MKTNLEIENKNWKKERNDEEKLENKINPQRKKLYIEYLPPGYQKKQSQRALSKRKTENEPTAN
jgi:hypothetical protein